MKKDKKKELRISKISIALFFFCIIAIAITMYIIYNKEERYLVKEGTIDHVTIGQGYIIKNETLIDIDATKVLVPTVSEGSRVTKGNIIATYRNQEYQQYQERLRDIDENILEALKDVKIEYSSEINNIEKQVLNSVIASKGITSMVNMQEQRVHINNLLSKKAALVGALSPEDAYVKQLIRDREQIEKQTKISTANIKATVSGLVSYTSDGLENKLNLSTIDKFNYEDVKNIVNNDKNITNDKIKITNNYEAYILVKASDIEDKYIKEGAKHTIKIIDSEIIIIEGIISRIVTTEEGSEVLFKITNGIENLIENRVMEIEVVWTSFGGLIVPNSAILKDEKGTYVKILTRGDYIDIRVNVDRKNKEYSIVSNVTPKGKSKTYVLEMYDQVIVNGN